jgi:predicted MFS family arabinose efflux permease
VRATTRLEVSGFLATAVAFGPAFVGYGLFLPQFRDAFALSSGTAGLIGSATFAGYVAAILLAGWLTARAGPRAPVVLGGLAAAAGMGLVALAPGVPALAVGIGVAGTSAGLSWLPFNNAAARDLYPSTRPRVLSVVSTGTAIGVAAAGLLALITGLTGLGWRVAWTCFAAAGAASAMLAVFALAPDAGPDRGAGAATSPRRLATPEIAPLAGVALSFGLTVSVFLSFAADRIVRAGGIPELPDLAVAPAIFLSYGLVGLIGVFSGAIERRVGLVAFLRAIFLASLTSHLLVALAPQSLPGVVVAAGLQGACVMTISAIFSFWSARLFPRLPAMAFSATLLSFAAGAVVGPALAGAAMDWIGDPLGAPVVFGAAGLVSLATAAGLPRRRIVASAA